MIFNLFLENVSIDCISPSVALIGSTAGFRNQLYVNFNNFLPTGPILDPKVSTAKT